MKPTRIIKEPYLGPGRNGRVAQYFECDNGRTYIGIEECADDTNMSKATLARLLNKYEWQDVDLTHTGTKGKRPRPAPDLDKKHIEAVNSYIPQAMQYANQHASQTGCQWTKHYLREMNRLTVKAGLRVY